MAIRYAKNPAELVIQNPTRRTMKRKRKSNGQFAKGKSGGRKNPSKRSTRSRKRRTRKNPDVGFVVPALLTAAGLVGVRFMNQGISKYGGKLPENVQKWGSAGLPVVASIPLLASGRSDAIKSAGLGLLLGGLNNTADIILKKQLDGSGVPGLSDGPVYLGDGGMSVQNGVLYSGNKPVAQITSGPMTPQANNPDPYLGDSWESGEAWEA